MTAFYGCSSLSSIIIPNSVTSIGQWAFRYCANLASMTVADGNSKYDSRNGCNAIIETATNTLMMGCKSTIIPNSVTTIGDYAFSGCSGLTSITIPNSVTSIGTGAFSGCEGLTSVTIGNGVTSIGSYAFANCSSLTSITFGNSLEDIGDWAFDNTAWYENQPDGLIYAGTVAYKYKGTMPDNTSITIKEGTLVIAREAFYVCSGLTSVTIPNSVKTIGVGAFRGCSGLTSVIFGNGVISIGDYAFIACSSITSVTIPNSVTTIGNGAFFFCTGLKSLTIGSGVKTIGEDALSYCNSLTLITSLATTPPVCGITVFYGIDTSACTLKVPEASIELYKTADQWKNFYNIEATGINTPRTDNGDVTIERYYDLSGRPLLQPRKGVNIVKRSDGTTHKVVIK